MTGDAAWESRRLAAVEAAEADVRSTLAEQLRSAVESDDAVASSLREWTGASDLAADPTESGELGLAVDRAAARQANVLTNHARYRAAVGHRPPPDLRRTPVSPFDGLEAPTSVADEIDSLAATLADDPDVTADIIGAHYADALSADERRARGQFYTPPPVARQLTRWVLGGAGSGRSDDRPRVLDPAAGTGTFPLAAFERLREQDPDAGPESLLSRLVAVDVDDAALHLAALRLSAAVGGRPVDALDRRDRSFFDLEAGEDGGADGEQCVPPVDAVVGNPPFVRAGDLTPDREHFRRHLDAFGPDGGAGDCEGDSRYADGEAALSRRSDAYVYFVTHATRFLRPGGRLGVVLPAKWLESDYGADFRRFLAEQYDVRAVVGFGARAFDALVDTVLLLAQRLAPRAVGAMDGCGEAGADVSFVRLEEPLDRSTSLAELVECGPTARRGAGGGPTRVVRRDRGAFASAEKCSPYLRAPADLLPLLDHPSFVRLGDLADVSRGVMTGANRFFLLDPAARERWGIDPALLRSAVRSIRGVESRTISADDVDLVVVDVHGFLARRLRGPDGDETAADPTERAKAALRAAGHDAFVDYVEHAEAEGWHEGRTCRTRRVWFDLGPLPTPDAFVPKLLRERVFTVRNLAGAVPTNAIDCLAVRDPVDPDVLLGVLDSSLCRALMEVWGRNEAGMLQLMTYETRTLPVPDVRGFGDDEATAIADAAADLDADGTGQAALDAAVHAALDVDLAPGRARAMRERLLARRVGGGDRVEVPVS